MTRKTSAQHMFDVQLNWLNQTKGVVAVKDATVSALIGTPPEFGGKGGIWTPEHLFLSSVAGCFMSTFLAFAKKIRFEISGFECLATGQVEVIDGKYKFTFIHLYPKAFLKSEPELEKALLAMEKTKKYCLISNSINAEIVYHPEVVMGEDERKENWSMINGNGHFTLQEAMTIGQKIGIDFKTVNPGEFRRGLEVEMEHGTEISESNVTNDDVYMTGKIALAHLYEIPDYYTRLDKMKKEAEWR